jgi:hypothetical protein
MARAQARAPLSLDITIFLGAAARAAPAAGAAAATFIKFRLLIIKNWYTATKSIVKLLQIILVLALALTSTAADKKKKPPDVQIVEASARRDESRVSLEGRLRNTGEKPIKALMLLFDFMAPGRQVITTQKAPIDEELLERGKEAVFHMELNAPPRAVEFQINASDGSGRELRVAGGGPFSIE